MNRKILALFLAAVTLLSILAGCGAGSQTPATDGPAEGVQTEGGSDVIKIAYTTPLTGDYAEYGVHFKNASAIALERINASGGINGRTLQIDYYDTKADATENVALAQKIVEEDYIAVLGDFTTTSCMAAAPVYQEAGLATLSPTASNPDFVELGDCEFAMYGTQADDSPYVAQYVIQKYLQLDNAAIIYFNTDWGLATSEYFKERADEIGLNIVSEEPISEGETDFSSIVSKLRQQNPEVVYVMANAGEVANFILQARKSGWDVPIIPSSSAVTEELITMVGEYAEGIVTNQVYLLSEDDPDVWEFAQEFKERTGLDITYFSLLAYDATDVLAKALIACGDDLTRANLRDKLADIDTTTLLGAFQFDESGKVRRQYKIVGYQDGGWKELEGYDYMDR